MVAADERGCWARFDLWRDADDPPFSTDDAQLLRDVSRSLGRGMRRATVRPSDEVPSSPIETGVLLVDENRRVCGSTPAVHQWFRVLNTTRVPYKGAVPSLVWSTAGRLLGVENGEDPGRAARIRARASNGRWAVIEASRLDGTPGLLALTIHAAAPSDVLDLFYRAHALTPREREAVALVAEGLNTRALAQRLGISAYTVQEHLQSAFGKLGVNSRLELLTRILAQGA